VSNWTGPHDGELDNLGRLRVDLPADRWPFCDPDEHDICCLLRVRDGRAGSFCDCSASAADEFADDPPKREEAA